MWEAYDKSIKLEGTATWSCSRSMVGLKNTVNFGFKKKFFWSPLGLKWLMASDMT